MNFASASKSFKNFLYDKSREFKSIKSSNRRLTCSRVSLKIFAAGTTTPF